jgi:pyridoxamine 5'-phosphate oxidase family protein
MFTKKEVEYLKSQRLARIATVSPERQPDVTPVGYEFDGQYIYIGGHNVGTTRKFKNVQAGNAKVALVVDDLKTTNPWQPRGIRIYGSAEIVRKAGWLGDGLYLRIKPEVSWSWNIEYASDRPGQQGIHKTTHSSLFAFSLMI